MTIIISINVFYQILKLSVFISFYDLYDHAGIFIDDFMTVGGFFGASRHNDSRHVPDRHGK